MQPFVLSRRRSRITTRLCHLQAYRDGARLNHGGRAWALVLVIRGKRPTDVHLSFGSVTNTLLPLPASFLLPFSILNWSGTGEGNVTHSFHVLPEYLPFLTEASRTVCRSQTSASIALSLHLLASSKSSRLDALRWARLAERTEAPRDRTRLSAVDSCSASLNLSSLR